MRLNVEPRAVKRPEIFKAKNPPRSIGLDGYVYGAPWIDPTGPWANFNHHEEVDRLMTRATCAQTMMAIKSKMLGIFEKDGITDFDIFVNDPDQDTCLAVWLLLNYERISGHKSEPLINALVSLEDFLDSTAGAYPIDITTKMLRRLAWIFDPYTIARMEGKIQTMSANDMRTTIDAVGARINKFSLGQGGETVPDTKYEKVGGGENWTMVVEKGFNARSKMFSDGITSFVSVRENNNGTWTYSIGKTANFIDFPVVALYKVLNEAEEISELDLNKWGGGDIIGGSPRQTGSKLSPQQVEKIINEFLMRKGKIFMA